MQTRLDVLITLLRKETAAAADPSAGAAHKITGLHRGAKFLPIAETSLSCRLQAICYYVRWSCSAAGPGPDVCSYVHHLQHYVRGLCGLTSYVLSFHITSFYLS